MNITVEPTVSGDINIEIRPASRGDMCTLAGVRYENGDHIRFNNALRAFIANLLQTMTDESDHTISIRCHVGFAMFQFYFRDLSNYARHLKFEIFGFSSTMDDPYSFNFIRMFQNLNSLDISFIHDAKWVSTNTQNDICNLLESYVGDLQTLHPDLKALDIMVNYTPIGQPPPLYEHCETSREWVSLHKIFNAYMSKATQLTSLSVQFPTVAEMRHGETLEMTSEAIQSHLLRGGFFHQLVLCYEQTASALYNAHINDLNRLCNEFATKTPIPIELLEHFIYPKWIIAIQQGEMDDQGYTHALALLQPVPALQSLYPSAICGYCNKQKY